MLTLKEIEEVKLGRAKVGGYKAEDVDNFIDKVRESYEKLHNENVELMTKVKVLAQRVNTYREQEDSVRNALIKAQKIEDDCLKEAQNKASEMLRKAGLEADKIVESAKREVVKQNELLESLKKSVKDFRTKVLNMYKEHLKLVNSLNSDERIDEDMLEKLNKKEINSNTDKTVEVSNLRETKPDKENFTIKSKFKDLKFGENYDLKSDNEVSPLGLFNRK